MDYSDKTNLDYKWGSNINPRHLKEPKPHRLNLLFSLLIHLQLNIRDLLLYLFSSSNKVVGERARRFTACYRSSDDDEEPSFGPLEVWRLWKTRFPSCRLNLDHYIVKPDALAIVLKESNAGMNSTILKVRLKSLDMHLLRRYMQPETLANHYKDLAPFTFDLLLHFASAPNKYRQHKLPDKAKTSKDTNATRTKLLDGSDGPEAAIEGAFGGLEGFSSNPTLVCHLHCRFLLR
jgi:hypothetical protein